MKKKPRRASAEATRAKDRRAVERKMIECFHCQHPMHIPSASASWQCPACSTYLDLKNHHIENSVGRSILTYGDITISERGSLSGSRAEGQNIILEGGRLAGQVKARNSLRVTRVSRLEAEVIADQILIEPGAVINCRKSMRCRQMKVEGRVRLRQLQVTGECLVISGGELVVETLISPSLKVEPGAVLVAATARCGNSALPPEV